MSRNVVFMEKVITLAFLKFDMLPGLYRGKGEYQSRISTNVWEYSYLTLCYNGRRGELFWWLKEKR